MYAMEVYTLLLSLFFFFFFFFFFFLVIQEHHLQRAISAQQIYGGSQRLIIPTPDAILYDSDYKQLKQRNVHMPKQLIHVQGSCLELLKILLTSLFKRLLDLPNFEKCERQL